MPRKPRIAPVAAEPKQERGRARMAAILDAASRTFADLPYDAVTMTAIAERSNTAIGQVYRFFPNREMLADAVLSQYQERIDEGLGGVAARAAMLSPREVGAALVSFMTGLGEHRHAALALIEARPDISARRNAIRERMLSRIREILAAIRPEPPAAGQDGAAELVLQLLKLAALAGSGGRPIPRGFEDEVRKALGAYLDVLAGGTGRDRPAGAGP